MSDVQHTILYGGGENSPLGQITLAASITQGHGIVPAHPYRVYGSYALVVITRGDGTYQDANGFSGVVQAGDAIFVHPALAHSYGPAPGTTWDEFYVIFSGPAFDAWRSLGVFDPKRPLYTLFPREGWLRRLHRLTEPADMPETGTVQVCRLLTLLTEIVSGTAAPQTAQPVSAWLPKACALLAGALDQPRRLEDLVRPLGMSYETFRRRFTREMGVPPAQFRASRVLETACHLLQYTSLTSAQIAERLCFSDEYHFSRRFKQIRGETPTEFRRRLR